jgi:SAM-dependent methyltransferase
MPNDPFAQFKSVQRESWGLFAPLATFTTPTAAALVDFAKVAPGETVLDVACGTGVVAVTAARAGATVRGVDLSPVLLAEAVKNAALSRERIEFVEGDVEMLPFDDASFDVVLSQFGHMFAPRPAVAIDEMLRVLRPGGRIAFSTWPGDLIVGRLFALTAQYASPPPGASSPIEWGDPQIVRSRLGDAVTDLTFRVDEMQIPALSLGHFRAQIEATAGPVAVVVSKLAEDPERLARYRAALEALAADYYARNVVRQHFLMARATKAAA